MKQQQAIYPIKRKPVNSTRISKRRRNNNFLSPVENFHQDDKKNMPQRQAERNIGQNISLIAKKQQGSFISNRQDHSLDSFDKMIMGVDEELDIEEENTSNSKENEVNYTQLYREFEQLVKYKVYKNDSAEGELEDSKILREDFFQEEKMKESSSFQMSTSGPSNIRLLRQKIQEIKDIRKQKIANLSNASDQNISMRLLGANLSQIHEEEIQHNTSINRMDPIQEEFIDFVSKNNETGKINISKIQKNNAKEEKKVSRVNKNELNSSIKQPEEDEVVAMLENQLGSRRQNLIEEESLIEEEPNINKKQGQPYFQKENYHQILRELDENQDKKLDNSNLNMSTILTKREEWINNRKDRSGKWKAKQLQLISKIKEILFNPYVEFSDEEDFTLEM